MREALCIAETMRGRTSPDPMVGAVVVKNGRVISRGYHAEFTTPHAETFALHKAGQKAKGATLYVNLEPCCHWGNNPPCTTAIIRSGIRRVVIGMKDPNPLVTGKGIAELRRAGITLRVGVLEERALKLNEAFIKYITEKVPFITLKFAMSLDGKIATASGESRYITGKEALVRAHKIRRSADAILVGVNTIVKDDPSLTVRLFGKKVKAQPIRVVLDSLARTPLTSLILKNKNARTIIVVSPKAPPLRVHALEKRGAQIIIGRTLQGKVDLKCLMAELGKRQIMSVLIEGGGETNASALAAGIVDRIYCFIAPKIIGGRNTLTPVEGRGITRLRKALVLYNIKVERIGHDIMIEGSLKP